MSDTPSGPDFYTLGLSVDVEPAVAGFQKFQAEAAKTGAAGALAGKAFTDGLNGQITSADISKAAKRFDDLYPPAKAADAGRGAARAMVDALEIEYQLDIARVKDGLTRGFITPEQARAAGRDAALAFNQSVIATLDKSALSGASNGADRDAYIALGNSLKNVEDASGHASLGLGRVRQELGTLVGRLTDTIPALDRVGASIASMAAGDAIVIGVLAGIALLGHAYEDLSATSRKAREEQDKLTASLEKWYEAKKRGAAGQRPAEVEADIKKLSEQQEELDKLTARLTSPQLQGTETGESATAAIQRRIDELRKAMQAERDQIVAGRGDITQRIADADVRDRNEAASNLAALITANQATSAERQHAIEILKQEQALLIAYSKPPEGSNAEALAFFLKERASIAQAAKQLQDALTGKVARPDKITEDPETQKILDGLAKQLEALRAVNLEGNKELSLSQLKAQVIGVEGGVRDLLNAKIKAEEDSLVAYGQYSGIALTERLKFIQAIRDQSVANADAKIKLEDEAFAQKTLSDASKSANEVAEKNAKTTSDGLKEGLKLYLESEAAASHLAATIEHDLIRSVLSFAQSGNQSFTAFFHVVEQGALRITDAIDASLAKQGQLYDEARRKNQSADAADIAQKIANLETLRKVAGGLSAAVAGGNIGYQVGGLATNQATGAYGGAIAGALTGFEIAGPLGAAVGALTGAVGGLLGAADAHKQAARALQDAAKSLSANIAAYVGGTAVQQQLFENNAKADALKLQAETLFAQRLGQAGRDGSRSEADSAASAYEKDQATITAAKNANDVQIHLDFVASITEQLNALRGPVGALDNQLAALKKSYDDNVASANALGIPLDDINALYAAQVAAAKAAYAEGQRQLKFSLDAREATAKGESALSDLLTRRAEEDAERFKAEQDGWSQSDKDRLVYIQGLEDEATALKQLTDAQQALDQANAAGPHGTLQSKQAADLQPLLTKQTKDSTDYDAIAALLDTDTKKYTDDLAANANAMTLDADQTAITTDKTALHTAEVVKAGDAAQIAAQKWADAIALINAAVSDIGRDTSLGITPNTPTNPAGLNQELHTIFPDFTGSVTDPGFIDTLLKRYTPYTGTPLTNQQETDDNFIQKFIGEFDRVFGTTNGRTMATDTGTGTNAAASSASGETQAVSYAAKSLTETTGNRMSDYLASILLVERDQLKALTGQPLSLPPASYTSTAYTVNNTVAPSSGSYGSSFESDWLAGLTQANGSLSQIRDLEAEQSRFYGSLSATPLPTFGSSQPASQPLDAAAIAQIVTAAIRAAPSSSTSSPTGARTPINITVRLTADPVTGFTISKPNATRIVAGLIDEIETQLYEHGVEAQIVTGDTTVIGA